MLEMVVVMAIIMIMMAIMLPVLLQAKNHATGGVCNSNLRQIYQAMELYSTHHGGGNQSAHNALYPPDLFALNLGAVTRCKSGGGYQPLWSYQGWNEYAAQKANPILVADVNVVTHQGFSLGLYRNGNIGKRRAEGDATTFRYWE